MLRRILAVLLSALALAGCATKPPAVTAATVKRNPCTDGILALYFKDATVFTFKEGRFDGVGESAEGLFVGLCRKTVDHHKDFGFRFQSSVFYGIGNTHKFFTDFQTVETFLL